MTRCFFLALLFLVGCSSGELADSETAEGKFKIAEELEKDERYEEAITKFTEIKNKHPYSKLATEAELRIADIEYKRENYIEAQNAYQLFREFHPKNPRSDYVVFQLAMSYFKQLPDTVDRDLTLAKKALLYFDEVLTSYKNSAHVKEASESKDLVLNMLAEKEIYIANFYFKKELFDSALGRYEGYLKTYPNRAQELFALHRASLCAAQLGERDKIEKFLKILTAKYADSSETKAVKELLK